MDTQLRFAEKYNWWTKDTQNISFETKLSYVLQRWKSSELFYVFQNIHISILEKAYALIERDNFSLKPKRKKAITELMKYKKSNEL